MTQYMTLTTAFSLFIFFIVFIACVDNTDQKFDNVNFKDTLNSTRIYSENNGDTIWRYETIYFTPANLGVDSSNSSYEAYEISSSNRDIYKISFKKEQVITFCDSMLTVLPPYRNQDDPYIFYQRSIYEHLKEQAVKNKTKMDEIINNNELAILLDRFSPSILNPDYKPRYIIVKRQILKSDNLITGNLKTYDIKGRLGDTINLTETIGEVQLKNSQ